MNSVILTLHLGQPDPTMGNVLSKLTRELKPAGYQWIKEFVSLESKIYAYQTNENITCVIVKGFTHNGMASQQLNFHYVKEMLHHDERCRWHMLTPWNVTSVTQSWYKALLYPSAVVWFTLNGILLMDSVILCYKDINLPFIISNEWILFNKSCVNV